MIMVMSRSIAQGQSAGVMTALGVSIGLMGHTALATFGLGLCFLHQKHFLIL
jgi:threonine/homoserine/homoserine lactone efflux protein